jgi:putative addiction module component (TIGR02574 family)
MYAIMTTATMRKKLMKYIADADDKKVKAIYAIIGKDIRKSALENNDEMKKELDRRYADYKNGKAKTITPEESKKRVQKILKAANRK